MIGEYIPCTMKYIKPYLSNLAKSMQIHLLLVLVENVMNGNISVSRKPIILILQDATKNTVKWM